jgi:hypothetical protein
MAEKEIKQLYSEVQKDYPDICEIADQMYSDYWNSLVEVEFSEYSWFESLANALNSEMQKQVDPSKYLELLELIRHSFMMGDADVKQAIDVAFVENLFWKVPRNKVIPYWEVFPEKLKKLYIGFHGSDPL